MDENCSSGLFHETYIIKSLQTQTDEVILYPTAPRPRHRHFTTRSQPRHKYVHKHVSATLEAAKHMSMDKINFIIIIIIVIPTILQM